MKFRIIEIAPGKWSCDVRGRLPDGRLYRRRLIPKVKTRKQAERFAQRHWESLVTGQSKPEDKKVPLLKDFAPVWMRDYCKANQLKPAGIEHKQLMLDAHLLPHLGELRLSEITTEHAQAIKSRMAGKSPKTINNALVVLSKLLKVAHEWGRIDTVPTIRLLRVEKKARAFLSVEHYARLRAGAAKVSRECLALVLLAGDAGLRRGEIFALKKADVDLSHRFIVVSRSRVGKHTSTTKGHSTRYVPLTVELQAALAALPKRGEFVLPDMTAKRARDMIKSAEAAGGLKQTGKLHVLRHTYASHLAMAGESLYHLQAALGHQDHTTTQGYSHLAPESLKRLAEAIDKTRGQSAGSENRRALKARKN